VAEFRQFGQIRLQSINLKLGTQPKFTSINLISVKLLFILISKKEKKQYMPLIVISHLLLSVSANVIKLKIVTSP
jgi:hypothetical protein